MITSKIKESKDVEEQTFPRLMRFNGNSFDFVVLFYEHGKGTVVHVANKNDYYKVGEYQNEWNMGAFKPFNGTIELTQE